jgi:hypothetical protein
MTGVQQHQIACITLRVSDYKKQSDRLLSKKYRKLLIEL